jgi:GntR family transcriptional regulator
MPAPLYRQIADDLREQIKTGALEQGQQLRTEAELQEHYKASRNTVRDAIKWLISLNLVVSKPGQGTFVAEKIEPFVTVLTADSKTPGASETEKSPPDVGTQVATEKIATRLDLPPGSHVIRRSETRKVGDIIWSRQSSYYPREFVQAGAGELLSPADIVEGAVEYLAKTLKRRESKYGDLITVRIPEVDEAQFFNLPEDGRVQVFEHFRTAFDQHGKPMRLTITVCPTDRNYFSLELDISVPAVLDEANSKQ